MGNLNNRVAVVTVVARGLGKATAFRLAKYDAKKSNSCFKFR